MKLSSLLISIFFFLTGASAAGQQVAGDIFTATSPTTFAWLKQDSLSKRLGVESEVTPIFKADFLSAATAGNYPFVGAAISTGTVAANTTNMTGNRPGVVRMTSSTTANSGYRWTTDVAPIRLKGDEVFVATIAPINFAITTMRCGFLDGTSSTDMVDGVYFEYTTTGALVLKTATNNTRTTSATITTLSLNTWYKLKIIVNSNATSVLGEVYDASGVFIASTTITTNIPTAAGRETGAGVVVTQSGTAAIAMLDLDFLFLRFNLVR